MEKICAEKYMYYASCVYYIYIKIAYGDFILYLNIQYEVIFFKCLNV